MAAKKTDPASTVIDGLKKKFKQASVRGMAEAEGELLKEVIPTGIEGLDNYVLGIGGRPDTFISYRCSCYTNNHIG